MRKTPGYKSSVLSINSFTFGLSISTSADTSQLSIKSTSLHLVIKHIPQLLDGALGDVIRQLDHLVGQISPVRSRSCWNQFDPGNSERSHVLGDVITQNFTTLPDILLEVRLGLTFIRSLKLIFSVTNLGKVGHCVPDSAGPVRSRGGPSHIGLVPHLVNLD